MTEFIKQYGVTIDIPITTGGSAIYNNYLISKPIKEDDMTRKGERDGEMERNCLTRRGYESAINYILNEINEKEDSKFILVYDGNFPYGEMKTLHLSTEFFTKHINGNAANEHNNIDVLSDLLSVDENAKLIIKGKFSFESNVGTDADKDMRLPFKKETQVKVAKIEADAIIINGNSMETFKSVNNVFTMKMSIDVKQFLNGFVAMNIVRGLI